MTDWILTEIDSFVWKRNIRQVMYATALNMFLQTRSILLYQLNYLMQKILLHFCFNTKIRMKRNPS